MAGPAGTAVGRHVPAAPYVGVVGPSEPDGVTWETAREVGRELARARAVVLCGGLGGVMAAVALGVADLGGTSIGVLPGTDRSAGNPYLSVALATGLGELRNGVLVRASDGVVAVGGSWGTLSEVALAVRLGLPVVTLGGWAVHADDGPVVGTHPATDPAGAVEAVLRLVARRRR
jgi:uncharacterized protein (TIGR00725 family)